MGEAARHLFLYCLLSPATCLYTPFQLTGTAAFPLELKLLFPWRYYYMAWNFDKNSLPWLVLPWQSAPFWLVAIIAVTLHTTKIQAKIHSSGQVKLLSSPLNCFHWGVLRVHTLALTLLLCFMVTQSLLPGTYWLVTLHIGHLDLRRNMGKLQTSLSLPTGAQRSFPSAAKGKKTTLACSKLYSTS